MRPYLQKKKKKKKSSFKNNNADPLKQKYEKLGWFLTYLRGTHGSF
jgi:hypothetical protein